MEPWRSNLSELARRENVYCKLSGLVTEADWKTWFERIFGLCRGCAGGLIRAKK